jgi:hypothetical protein
MEGVTVQQLKVIIHHPPLFIYHREEGVPVGTVVLGVKGLVPP